MSDENYPTMAHNIRIWMEERPSGGKGGGLILIGDAMEQLKTLPDESVYCCVTSPPYWGLRDYGVDGQLGLEKTPQEFVDNLVHVFREVRRVLRDDGTMWLNLGDCWASNRKGSGGKTAKQSTNKGSFYADIQHKFDHGLKQKDLVGIPWRVAFALQADGWYLRQDIIWHKPNPMPESVRDRCTKSHEYIFMFSKKPKYYYDQQAIKEPCVSIKPGGKKKAVLKEGLRIRRSVWSVTIKSYREAHFATFPPDLIEPCILAGCPEGGTVLDPFFGAGTTGLVAEKHGRKWIGIELNPEYAEIAKKRVGA